MDQKTVPPRYTAEFRERGVRLFRDHRSDYDSDNAAYHAIASKLGCSKDSLCAWCVQAARDAGERAGPTSEDKARIKALERENRELRQANEILKKATAYFAPSQRLQANACRATKRSSTARSANDHVHRRVP